jgi:hypothetical protein
MITLIKYLLKGVLIGLFVAGIIYLLGLIITLDTLWLWKPEYMIGLVLIIIEMIVCLVFRFAGAMVELDY